MAKALNNIISLLEGYHKIPKISPRTYLSKALFEGLIYGGKFALANFLSASLIVGSKFTVFALFYFIFEGNFPSTSPRGLIFGGAI